MKNLSNGSPTPANALPTFSWAADHALQPRRSLSETTLESSKTPSVEPTRSLRLRPTLLNGSASWKDQWAERIERRDQLVIALANLQHEIAQIELHILIEENEP